MPRRKAHSSKSAWKKETGFIVAVVVVLAIGAGYFLINQDGLTGTKIDTTQEIAEVEGEVTTLADGTKFIVNPNEILSGGPPKGGIGVDRGIPAIINPKFISIEEANEQVNDNDIVFGITLNGESRAYTKDVLIFHEIVNDWFGEDPVLVTYCPLCGTAIAFDPTINGEVSRFGTSGKLYKSNLVMYDELTESYWSQVGGKAIIGPLSGTVLEQVSIDTLLYRDWKKFNPDGVVLSQDTGFIRPYGAEIYGDYFSSGEVGFGVSFTDTRLHPKVMVAGLTINDESKAYPAVEVGKVKVVNDELGDKSILVTVHPGITIAPETNPLQIYDRNLEGEILYFELVDDKLVDRDTQTEWDFNTGTAISGELEGSQLTKINHFSDFWFNWVSFHEDTALYISQSS